MRGWTFKVKTQMTAVMQEDMSYDDKCQVNQRRATNPFTISNDLSHMMNVYVKASSC